MFTIAVCACGIVFNDATFQLQDSVQIQAPILSDELSFLNLFHQKKTSMNQISKIQHLVQDLLLGIMNALHSKKSHT